MACTRSRARAASRWGRGGVCRSGAARTPQPAARVTWRTSSSDTQQQQWRTTTTTTSGIGSTKASAAAEGESPTPRGAPTGRPGYTNSWTDAVFPPLSAPTSLNAGRAGGPGARARPALVLRGGRERAEAWGAVAGNTVVPELTSSLTPRHASGICAQQTGFCR